MVEGESGILACSPPWFYPIYEPSKRRLTWPNKCRATLYSADEPGRLRGPQHYKAWADEASVWQYEEAWDNLMFGLRLGDHPQCVVTTTPKRTKIVKALMALENAVTTVGTTYDNIGNLASAFIETIIKKYEGTTLGKQELLGKLVEDVDGALWNHKLIDDLRVNRAPQLSRVVVAVDPSGSSAKTAAECGIVTCGIGKCRCKGKEETHGFVLDDRSLRASPNGWSKVVLRSYYTHKADRIVAEINYGGEMVETTIKTIDRNASYRGVTATRGKAVRAEPVAALFEQGKIHHVGSFAYMEDEMCTWVPGDKSPNRMDALVWAFTDLMLKNSGISVEVL
jgi:phage terminase large subunit-like protein